MKALASVFAILLSTGVAGCATGGAGAPPAATLAQLPLVRYGAKTDLSRDHILYFPAGEPVPLQTIVKGNIFSKESESETKAVLAKDIYVFKQWVSFDRKTWISGRQAFRILVNVRLPSYESRGPGVVSVQMDATK